MKTVRFSQVVAKCGHPESHLLLTDPKQDHALQSALKAKRVMTLMQASVGTKSDWGEPGFHPGTHRQYLIFPKSLAAYASKAVIGIKYELLNETEAPRPRPKAPPPPKKAPIRAKPPKAIKPPPPVEKEPTPPEPPPRKVKDQAPEITSLKRQVKRAMQALEKGKQVAAFSLLQKILDA